MYYIIVISCREGCSPAGEQLEYLGSCTGRLDEVGEGIDEVVEVFNLPRISHAVHAVPNDYPHNLFLSHNNQISSSGGLFLFKTLQRL